MEQDESQSSPLLYGAMFYSTVRVSPNVTTNGEATELVPYSTMLARLRSTSKCNAIPPHTRTYIAHKRRQRQDRDERIRQSPELINVERYIV